ncbi:primosomal protein N' [Synechococcus sp. BSF8S]|uniref:replication restart helicase PriA n=1 Tax=Synechococcales TaxID=1890424 RepID=UPI0016273BA5|nr:MULTISPECIES: primosomal protein N' [unclassified Synechococcus]MBC1260817.1 primosomal protein N' [Synechococcus sp. BSF8S]MBC1263493.1 primosomal protein N' [Synechococcus sp. BSA11S]
MGFARRILTPLDTSTTPLWVQVWVEAGREGRIFTYAAPPEPRLAAGDLVRLRLRGRRQIGLVVEVLAAPPDDLDPAVIQPVEGLHQAAAVDTQWQALLQDVAHQCHTSLFRTLKTALPPGWLGQQTGRAPAPGRTQLWLELVEVPMPLTCRQRELTERLRGRPGAAAPMTTITQWGFSRSLVQNLQDKGWLSSSKRPLPDGTAAPGPWPHQGNPEEPRQLNPEQQQALEQILAGSSGQEFLLWGVTGAGKTEVYLQAAAACLASGRSALLLTPEIGLIPQLLDRCRARFAGSILEFHSGLSQGERIAAWRRCLQAGGREPLMAVGTRSAVFLPLAPLGLVILDEEHDTSYKQESPMPCYHAREVARLRCRQSGARLVLGSATPALESWLACRRPGQTTTLLRLSQRISGQAAAPVRVVDLRQELAEGHRRLISRALMARMEHLQERGEQAVVLVPRRGYSSFLSCRSCGEVVECPHCDVALTVHRLRDGSQTLRCHWCGHRQPLEARCGGCGSAAFKPFGAGTQRVMEQLEQELAGLRLLRFDRDSTRGRDGHRRLLARFAAGEADVLVGTQMLAKGMDLPRVTLAVVLAADGLLHRPDLRASEHCLQLLLQLAGRAGRGERPGEVIVQTYLPDHPVIRHLIDGRYDAFLEEELEIRRQAGLVPFSRACLLRLAGASAAATATAAASLAERLRPRVDRARWQLIGPAPAPVARVAGRYRWHLLLHGPPASDLPLPPEADLRAGLDRSVSLAIDPDPIEL